MNCRRCKKEFTPKHQEARCSDCLRLRQSNRIAKRKQDHASERSFESVRRMMESNGGKKGSSKVVGMLH